MHSPFDAAGDALRQAASRDTGTYTACRRTFSILERGEAIATSKVVSSLLRNITINLWGLGATIIGLQVGFQHGKLLFSGASWAPSRSAHAPLGNSLRLPTL